MWKEEMENKRIDYYLSLMVNLWGFFFFFFDLPLAFYLAFIE